MNLAATLQEGNKMRSDRRNKVRGDLEDYIDGYSLDYVLREISIICDAKAEHISTYWQDNVLASDWSFIGKEINKVAEKAAKRGL